MIFTIWSIYSVIAKSRSINIFLQLLTIHVNLFAVIKRVITFSGRIAATCFFAFRNYLNPETSLVLCCYSKCRTNGILIFLISNGDRWPKIFKNLTFNLVALSGIKVSSSIICGHQFFLPEKPYGSWLLFQRSC